MYKSISQDYQNDKQISASHKRFFARFHVSSALKASNAYKQKGIPVIDVFQYLFLLIFSNRSLYMSFITGRDTPSFAKDTVYRFMKMPRVNGVLLSSENKKSRINEAHAVDKRNARYKRRCLSMEKRTFAMLALLKEAKKAAIPAKYVLFGSWFFSPSSLHAVKEIGYDAIGMVKKTPKMFFDYNGEDMPLVSIHKQNRKRRGKSNYLLFVMVEAVKDGKSIPAKVVYVRNRNKRKEYLRRISTDTALSEEEIIRIYGKRWDTEVFFKVCKSYLKLGKECNSPLYNAMTAHTAIVFTRYMMLSLESRVANDDRSLGELFLYFCDEMSDITWIQAFQMLLQMFRTILADNTELFNKKIVELVDVFIDTIPAVLKIRLQTA